MIKYNYYDDFKNRATIEEIYILPYAGSPIKERAYILKCYATYENDLLYYVSIYETLCEAEKKLNEFSCKTFKRRY